MSIKKQALLNLIGRLFEFLVGMGTPIILVRIFSQTEYGLYQQGLVIGAPIAMLLGFNFSQSLFYFFPLAETQRDRAALLSQTFFILAGVGCVFTLGMLVLRPVILDLFDSEFFSTTYLVIPLFVWFTILRNSFDNLFVIEGKAQFAMVYYSLNRLLRGILVIAAALWFHTPTAALWALVVYLGLVVLFLFSYLRTNYKISPLKFQAALFRKQFSYALPFGLSGIAGTLGNSADKIMVTTLMTAKDLAIYSVGSFRLPFIELIYTSVGNVILPQISRYSREPDGLQKAFRLWKKMLVKNVTITLPAAGFAVLFAVEIITFLFGASYEASAVVFKILIVSFLIQMLGFGYMLRGFARTRPIFPANLAKMVASLTLGGLLIWEWGYVGAAISYVVAFWINGVIQLEVTRRMMDMRWGELLPWKEMGIVLLGVILASIIASTSFLFDTHVFFHLAFGGILYFSVIYAWLYWRGMLPALHNLKSYFT